jgi:hypothetical protein
VGVAAVSGARLKAYTASRVTGLSAPALLFAEDTQTTSTARDATAQHQAVKAPAVRG